MLKKNYRMYTHDSKMRGYFFIGFIDFMSKGKSLLEYTSLFSPDEDRQNEKTILKYFQ